MDCSKTEPEVGIFWTWESNIFYLESASLSKAVHTQISIDYSVGHYAAWFIMAKRGLLNRLPHHLRDEYDSIPRGRIVFLFSKNAFVIYHGDEFNQNIREQIVQRLHLSGHHVYDEVDEHYNPLPDDFLF